MPPDTEAAAAPPSFSTDLLAALRQARHVLVFTGAGVSAESGIPTFRDALTGLWARFDAQQLATAEAYQHDSALVWGWYEWRRMKIRRAQPNPAHRAIAALAHKVPQLSLVTQNVDDLHERAGSVVIAHLHGEISKPLCFDCGLSTFFPNDLPDEPEGGRRLEPPRCGTCGGPIRPGVVWFGEPLPPEDWARAMDAARDADIVISVGTSNLVYPAAEIPELAARRGATVIQVNPAATSMDRIAQHTLQGPAGIILPALVAAAFPPSRASI
ncbi:MAG: NAD-dependent deacylase [Zoogloeaceae bacterium]|nr:NAD-dependent deacylase [Zoogloeaceae bacterium]